jgi:hypothetical protein
MPGSTLVSNPGTGGYQFASDKQASTNDYYPYSKIVWGTHGSEYKIVDKANALPVQQTGTVVITHTNPTIGTGSSTVVTSNSDAKYRFIQNNGAFDAWLNIGGTASLNTGIKIAAGGSYEMSCAIGNMDTRTITAISTSGSLAFSVTEGA